MLREKQSAVDVSLYYALCRYWLEEEIKLNTSQAFQEICERPAPQESKNRVGKDWVPLQSSQLQLRALDSCPRWNSGWTFGRGRDTWEDRRPEASCLWCNNVPAQSDRSKETNSMLRLREARQPQCSSSEFIFEFPVSPTLQSGLRR